MKRAIVFLLLLYESIISQQYEKSLKYYEIILPELIDPVYGSEFMIGRRCTSLLFRSLYGFNWNREFVDFVAKGSPVPIGTDGRHFSVNIKPSMKWHDGQPITSGDIVRSFQILTNPATGYSGVELLRRFTKVSAGGPQKILIEMRERTDSPEYFLIFPILPSHLLSVTALDPSNIFCRHPVGNGPFKLLKKEISTISFRRFDEYSNVTSDNKNTNIDKVILEERSVQQVWISDLKSNSVDILVEVPLNLVTDLDGLTSVGRKEYPNYEVDMFGFNMRDPKSLLNLRFVREAIYRGFDRQKTIASYYRDKADIITGPYPFGSYYYWGSVAKVEYDYDPNRAIQILDKNGCKRNAGGFFVYNGNPLSFNILAVRSAEKSMIITSFQKAMKNIGIEIKDPIYQTADVYKSYLQTGNFDIALITPNYGEDFDISPLFDSKSKYNYWGYKSTTVDEYFNKLHNTTDPNIRLQYGHSIHQKIHEDIPCLFLWTKKKFVGYNKAKISEIDPHPLDFFLTINEWRYTGE